MRKLTILFLALTLSAGLWAETMNGVKYIDADGVEQTADSVNIVTNANSTVTWGQAGQTSWYVVTGTDVQLSKGAVCFGNVNLILVDGTKLTSTGELAGIQVSGEGNSLTIYGQTAQMGQLEATGHNGAGIGNIYPNFGSNIINITINGGIVTSTGGCNAAGIGGASGGDGSNITINGGTVTANGGSYAAGIGGGNGGSGFNITIKGGEVKANGGEKGAGIGGGLGGDGSNITINGGRVTANGGFDAAGIGGGEEGSGSNITINGGIVTSTGGYSAAGIGGGFEGSGSNITINGGIVTSTGGYSAAGIGGGDTGSGSYITINGGSVTANGGNGGAGIGGGEYGAGSNIIIPVIYRIKADGRAIHHDVTDIADLLAGKRYVSVCTDAYLDERTAAYVAINALTEGIADEYIQTVGATAIEDIFQEDDKPRMEAIKTKALADLQKLIGTYNSGKAAGKEEAFGSLGTKQNGPAVIVTDQDDKQIILYSPKKVQYIKVSDK